MPFRDFVLAVLDDAAIAYNAAASACEIGGQWQQAMSLFAKMSSKEVDLYVITRWLQSASVEFVCRNAVDGARFEDDYLQRCREHVRDRWSVVAGAAKEFDSDVIT